MEELMQILLLLMSLSDPKNREEFYSQSKNLTITKEPIAFAIPTDPYTIKFSGYEVFLAPDKVENEIINNVDAIPDWIFVMPTNIKEVNELRHRGFHNGLRCNTYKNNKILFHVKTAGAIQLDIIFRTFFKIKNAEHGIITNIDLDQSYVDNQLKDFKMILWVFRYPVEKDKLVVIIQGYFSYKYVISFISNNIKWHVETAIKNFGKQIDNI